MTGTKGRTLRRRGGDGGAVSYSGSTSTSTLSPTPALRIRDQEVASYEYLVGPQVYGRRLVGLRRRNREIDRFREQVFADTVAPHGVDVYAHVERVHALASRQIEPHPLQLTPELSELAFHAHLAAFLPGAERRAETVLLPMLRPKV